MVPSLSSVVIAGWCGAAAMAQQPATVPAPAPAVKPAEHAPTALVKTDAPKAAAPAAVGYPATPPKNLYASNDFRNKEAPKLEVEEWLSAKPETAGKTVLIDFWATWCKPCRDVIPEMEAWQQKFKDDLVVIGLTSESKRAVENFYDLRGEAIKYAVARDGLARNYKQLNISGIPHVLVISSDGVVRYQGFPIDQNDPLTEAKLKQIIDADKAARAPATAGGEAAKPSKPADTKPGEPPAGEAKPKNESAPPAKK